MLRSAARAAIVALVPVAFLGCTTDDDPDGAMMDPTPVAIDGEWSVRLIETEDPCGVGGTTGFDPWRVDDGGAGQVTITKSMLGSCRSGTYLREGNRLTRTSGGLLIDFGGGPNCTAQLEQVETLDFAASSIGGTVVTTLTEASGPCSRPYPCVVRQAVDGARCTGCWPGCT